MRNLKIVALASAVLLNSNATLASNADDRYLYVGTELGISEPVVKSFLHETKDGDTRMRLKQSRMFGGRVGYSFYPNMAVEISATHQPKYRLAYSLPATDLTASVQQQVAAGIAQAYGLPAAQAEARAKADYPSVGIPSITDVTKISGNVVMLNWVYEFEKQKFGLKPYVIFGAGVAQVTIRAKETLWQPPANLAQIFGTAPLNFFKVTKSNQNCFAYQMGGGISRDISDNFAVDLGAKLQVVKDIKIKFQTLDIKTKTFKPGKPIKKTIGVGEFTLGFTFKIPVK